MNSSLSYRPEIDGLRAIAVLSVFIYHLFPSAFPSGFIGVDIFFVISGYLISQVINKGIEDKTFSMKAFYLARIRRLFPSMAVVVITTLILGYIFLIPKDYEMAAKAAASSLLFVSNMFFTTQSGYFSPDLTHNPFLHTWSLSVEEQFYMVFPFLMIMLFPFGKNRLIRILSALFLASLLLAIWSSSNMPTLGFFGLHTRAWEMLAGALGALWLQPLTHALSLRVKNGLSLLGLGLLALSFVIFDTSLPHPSWPTLLPVMGTVLILIFGIKQTLCGAMLSWRPAVFIGLISYSLYLWHQPLIVLTDNYLDASITPLIGLGVLLVSIGLASLTTFTFEAAFRHGSWKNTLDIKRFVMVSVVLLSAALVIDMTKGATWRMGAQTYANAIMDDRIYKSITPCHFSTYTDLNTPNCIFYPREEESILLWGDSHARSLAAGWVSVFSGQTTHFYSTSSCPSMSEFHSVESKKICADQNKKAKEIALSSEGPQTIVLMSRWAMPATQGTRVDNKEGGIETRKDNMYQPDKIHLPFDEAREGFFNDQVSIIKEILDTGKKVVLVYGVPEMGWHVKNEALKRAWTHGEKANPVSVSLSFYKERTGYFEAVFDAIPDHPNLIRIKPQDVFCTLDRCLGQIGKHTLYVDDDHLNDTGGYLLAAHIKRVLDNPAIIDNPSIHQDKDIAASFDANLKKESLDHLEKVLETQGYK